MAVRDLARVYCLRGIRHQKLTDAPLAFFKGDFFMTTNNDDLARPDGGERYLTWNLNPDALESHERDMLQALGAALLSRWPDLPRDVQKSLFEAAISDATTNAEVLKSGLARFLHDNAE